MYQENYTDLAENLINLEIILSYLIREEIIVKHESEEILNGTTSFQRNSKLLDCISKKYSNAVEGKFLEILRKTSNENCANIIIEGLEWAPKRNVLHPKISKWWPEQRLLIKSLHKRKIGNKLLVDELDETISKENRMVVICETAEASKLCGMGGFGKTLTAKWYAHKYKEKYQHILWIDCTKGRFLPSFKRLARDLEIVNRNELVCVEECFDTLSKYKCLWIYDNAESYEGEYGIINALPKNKENFYCLITSRSRNWGENISNFEVNIFGEDESLDFLKDNLSKEIQYTESQLREMSHLLGNFPLALQLAVVDLNNGKINLENYKEDSFCKDLEIIADLKFDDYGKTISENVKSSLYYILKEKHGITAHKALMIFGYIRSNGATSKYLMKILNCSLNAVNAAIDLLEKFSLVTKIGTKLEFLSDGFFERLFGRETEISSLSIQWLLQLVIRHNGKSTEKETLRKILGCKGFRDYKIIPFIKYADKYLKREFPEVKAKLLDVELLKKLLKEDRIEESVLLAKFIDEVLQSGTSKFNYAICLERNGEVEEAVNILKGITVKESRRLNDKNINVVDMELLNFEREPTEVEIADLLFYFYFKLRKFKKALTLGAKLPKFPQIIKILIAADISNYSLTVRGDEVELQLGGTGKRIELRNCSVDLSEDISVDYLLMSSVIVLDWKEANWTVGELWLGGTPFVEKTKLKVKKMTICNYFNISCLPQTIQELCLLGTEVVPTGGIELPNLKCLKVQMVIFKNLPHLFQTIQPTHLFLDRVHGEINGNLLPASATQMRIINSYYKAVVFNFGELYRVRRLDKLILECFHFDEILKILNHCQPSQLVIYRLKSTEASQRNGIRSEELIDLLKKKQIKSIVIGNIYFSKDDFSKISKYVNVDCSLDYSSSRFFLFEEDRVKKIHWEEFHKFLQLY